MSHWLKTLRRLQGQGVAAVVVSVVATRGSVPREAGATMLVTADASFDTVGGGHLEFRAIELARDWLAGRDAPLEERFPLGASLGQCCGGVVWLRFERVAPQDAWVARALERLARSEPLVLARAADGSGGCALVGRDWAEGEGGAAPLAEARTWLAQGEGAFRRCTVGGVEWLLKRLTPAEQHLVLFGAGHVGRALVRVLGELPWSVTWVDEREEMFPPPTEVPDNVELVSTDLPLAEVEAAPPGSLFLVMTHNHALDFELVRAILARDDVRYCGMIGSASKRANFERRLRHLGHDEAQFDRITCPIGIAGIDSKLPMAIAVAVVAELLRLVETAPSRVSVATESA